MNGAPPPEAVPSDQVASLFAPTEPRRYATQIRFPADLLSRLHEEAEARGVPVNWLVCKLVQEGLDDLIPASEMRLTRPPPSAP